VAVPTIVRTGPVNVSAMSSSCPMWPTTRSYSGLDRIRGAALRMTSTVSPSWSTSTRNERDPPSPLRL
jgi:hypothetical protein